MKILVTGAAGFLGRALIARLSAAPMASDQRLTLVDQTAMAAPLETNVLVGDIGAPALLESIATLAPDVVFHLAAVPGGAATADPGLSRRVNLDGALGVMEAVCVGGRPQFIYASSIAVFGTPLPSHVDDFTPARPGMTYGAHKLMVETALADAVRRGVLTGVALRLPGLVARPAGATGLKSAFLSDIFHALVEGRRLILPVGPEGRVWVQSTGCAVDNLIVAARADLDAKDASVINTPALHLRVGDLVEIVASELGVSASAMVDYAPDAELEAAFAAYPPLLTPAAERLGLRHEGDARSLVRRTLADMKTAKENPC